MKLIELLSYSDLLFRWCITYMCNVRNVTTATYYFDNIQCFLKYRRNIEFYFFVAFIGYPFLHFINNFIKEFSCKSVLYRIDNDACDTKMARSQVTSSALKRGTRKRIACQIYSVPLL